MLTTATGGELTPARREPRRWFRALGANATERNGAGESVDTWGAGVGPLRGRAGPRILIVDDEALIRWSLRERLTAAGFEVSEAADGSEALARFAAGGVHLLLLDCRLPDTHGLDLLTQLWRAAAVCPCIVMTACSTPEMMAEAEALGVLKVLTKPFDMDELVNLVLRAVGPM